MVDTHVHYDLAKFDGVREELLEECHTAGIEWMVNCAIEFETNTTMREMLGQYPWIYYAIGFHPSRVGMPDEKKDVVLASEIRKMAQESRVVAIGETGLDYHYGKDEKVIEHQKEWFRTLITIADENNLPLVLHIREADHDAMELLKEYPLKDSGVVHCFNSGWDVAEFYLDKGLYLGLGGSITHAERTMLRDVVKKMPAERMLLETDAPYIKPVGCQTPVNTSLELPKVVKVISELKDMEEAEVIRITTENAKRLFHITK